METKEDSEKLEKKQKKIMEREFQPTQFVVRDENAREKELRTHFFETKYSPIAQTLARARTLEQNYGGLNLCPSYSESSYSSYKAQKEHHRYAELSEFMQ